MAGTRSSVFALAAILAMAIVAPLFHTTTASAECSASVSRYGQCAYNGDLLFCGTCALQNSQKTIRGCDRCGAGYHCKSNSCAVINQCGYQYRCDLCGCSWVVTGD